MGSRLRWGRRVRRLLGGTGVSTVYTYRMIVVVRAANAAAANAAAATIDPGGGPPFANAPLRFATSTPSTVVDAYWCSWQMTQAQAPALRQALRDNGFSQREVGMVGAGQTPNMNDTLWAFDASAWTSKQVLAALGMVLSDFDAVTH